MSVSRGADEGLVVELNRFWQQSDFATEDLHHVGNASQQNCSRSDHWRTFDASRKYTYATRKCSNEVNASVTV